MTSPYFLAIPGGVVLPDPVIPVDPATVTRLDVTLESLDGTRTVPLDDTAGFRHMPGSTGLEMAPVSVVTAPIPSAFGSQVGDVRVEQREVFLPIFVSPDQVTQTEHLRRMDRLRSVVDPLTGEFRIVCATSRGERELLVQYTGGLEGNDSPDANGLTWAKVGLTAVATQPFAQARTDRVIEFGSSNSTGPFIGAVGGTDALWPRALASSAVIGSNMDIIVASEVPVYPTLELFGPMSSFTGTLTPTVAGQAWFVSVPNGVAAGQSLKIVTEPRRQSIRANGTTMAAGRVARGSTLRPFLPGLNVLDVAAPGATSQTMIRLTWREQFRSLW